MFTEIIEVDGQLYSNNINTADNDPEKFVDLSVGQSIDDDDDWTTLDEIQNNKFKKGSKLNKSHEKSLSSKNICCTYQRNTC
jgi:hypothetical protein